MRRPFCLVLILSLANPVPGVCRADELRPVQEGTQQAGLESRLAAAGTEEGILVYLDPKVKNGRLVRPGEPFRVERKMNRWLWDRPEVKTAKVVALSNMRTTRRRKSGKAQFSLSGPRYGTTLDYDADSPPRLLVLADPKTQLPIAAYSIPGGELVYSESEQIQIFLDVALENGRLTGTAKPYRAMKMVHETLWEDAAVRKAKTVVLANVPTGKRDDILSFHVAGQGYPTILDYVPGEPPPHLLVVMDPQARVPSAAYDRVTGEQVFPGSNQMRVYLDPKIEGGKLVGNPAPLLITGKATASFWKNKKFQGASNLVFTDVPTRKSANKGNHKDTAVFSVRGRGYFTTKKFDSSHPLRLLVVVDLKSREPTAAYDMETGEQVFSTDEWIPVHLNPRIEAGRLVGEPEPFALMHRNLTGLWERTEVKRAAAVALENVPIKRSTMSKSEVSAAFGLAGETYVIDRQFNPDQDLRLLVVVDPSTRFPIEAYDSSTGERVFSEEDLIRVYINPSVQNGRLAGDARPFRIARAVSGKVWNQREIREAETVALSNVSTIHVAGIATFFVDTRGYPTRRRYDAEHPFRLLVIADPATRIPTAAYDLSTGEEVFSAGDLVQIYLNPRIEQGRLSAGEKPFHLLQIPRLSATFWSKPEVEQATTLALANVQASNLRGTAGFYLGNTGYRTTRRFDADHPLRLLIHERIDPWLPIAAYDMATGEQIYPVIETPADPRLGALTDLAEEGTQAGAEESRVYGGGEVKKGKLVGVGKPIWEGRSLFRSSFWGDARLKGSSHIMLENVSTYDQNGASFHWLGKHHRTNRAFDAKHPLRLWVKVSYPDGKLLNAWDMATGEEVYSIAEKVRVYMGGDIEEGNLVNAGELIWEGGMSPRPGYLNDERLRASPHITVENVRTHRSNNHFFFQWQKRTYPTSRRFDPENPLRLWVKVSHPDGRVLGAWDMATGEQVYPVPHHIRVYSGGEIEKGELSGAGSPVWRGPRMQKFRFWNDETLKSSSHVVLENVPTFSRARVSNFTWQGRRYPTDLPFDEVNPPRLWVKASYPEGEVLGAWDMATGEPVQLASGEIKVYAAGEIRNGELAGVGDVIWSGDRVFRTAFWKDTRLSSVAHLTLENIPTNNRRNNSFIWQKESFVFNLPFDAEGPLRLWVRVSYPEGEVLGAWDMATGKQVYSPSENIRVYAKGEIGNRGLINAGEPIWEGKVHVKSGYWSDARLKRAPHLILENVRIRNAKGRAVFTVVGQDKKHTYPAGRRFDPKNPLRLWVKVSYPQGEVLGAWDMATREQVYFPPEKIRVYPGGQIERTKLADAGNPIWEGRPWERAGLFSRVQVEGAAHITLENVMTVPSGEKSGFKWGTRFYPIDRPFDENAPLHLWVKLSYPEEEVLGAWDMATGEQVYSFRETIKVYASGEVKGRKLTNAGQPIWQGWTIRRPRVWKEARLKGASHLILENVRTYDQAGRASFHWSSGVSRNYRTTRAFNAASPMRLWVKVSYPDGEVLSAWDQSTGEQVYPARSPQQADPRLGGLVDLAGEEPAQAGAEEKIAVYLDPKIKNGRLADGSRPFMKTRSFYRGFWSYPKVQRAKTIAIAGKPTYQLSRNPLAYFYFRGKPYPTALPFNSKRKQRLLLVVDVLTQMPTAAYDMDSGKRVYALAEKVKVYLDPVVEKGRLKSPQTPVRAVQFITRSFWAKLSARTNGPVALEGLPTSPVGAGKTAAFSLDSETYITDQRFDPENPLRLLVLVDPAARVPLAAYDLKTGRQVYSPESRIQVYLDPKIEHGRLVPEQKPFRSAGVIHPAFWEQDAVLTASAVVFSGVGTYHVDGMAKFSLAGNIYLTRRPFDPDEPFRLLVVADPRARIPVAAYDQESGEQVYDAEDFIRVYLDPKIEDGFLLESEKPFLNISNIRAALWKRPKIKASKSVAFHGVSTSSKINSLFFSLGRSSYPLSGIPGSTPPFKLLVVADPESKAPTAAYHLESGKQVYDVEKMIRIYINPVVSNGRLVGPEKPLKSVQMMTGGSWKDVQSHSSGLVALKGISTRAPRGKRIRAVFSLFGRSYAITHRFDADAPLRLLVLADPSRRKPVSAYDLETGEQVYPAPQWPGAPADARLAGLADLAEGETQAGAEEKISIYLDPKIEGGKLVGDPEPYQVRGQFRSELWRDGPIQGARMLGLANVPTHNMAGTAVFGFSSETYHTRSGFDPDRPLRLLLLVDVAGRSVKAAYDMETGEEVFSDSMMVRTYLNPPVEGGRLSPQAVPYKIFQKVSPAFWRDPAVKEATVVGVANVVTRDRGDGTALFTMANRNYSMDQKHDPKKPVRLLVLVDPKSQIPSAAYDLESGTLVYEMGNAIHIYLDDSPTPYRIVRTIKKALWGRPEVAQAKKVVLAHLPTWGRTEGGSAIFSVANTQYIAARKFDPDDPLKLRVVVDPKERIPTAAYDMKTGAQVEFRRVQALIKKRSAAPSGAAPERDPSADTHFEVKPRFEVYLDPRVEGGKLVSGQQPFRVTGALSAHLWERSKVKQAATIGVLNLATYPDRSGTAQFKVAAQIYSTTERFNPDARMFLLVLIDPRTKLPVVAYDKESGKQVYPGEDWVRVYLNPQLEDGRLVSGQRPYRALQVIYSRLFDEPAVKGAGEVALEGVLASRRGEASGFSLLNQDYLTTRSFDEKNPLKLLVIVDAQSRLPKAAYDPAGERVFYDSSQMFVYADPTITEGRLAADAVPLAVMPVFRPSLWNDVKVSGAKTMAISNITGGDHQGAEVFRIASEMYRTGKKYDPGKSLRVLAVMDVRNRLVTVAYDMATGEKIFSAEDLVRVYADPILEEGRLAGDPEPLASVELVTEHLWDKPEVKEAGILVLDNISTHTRYKDAMFSLMGQVYQTTHPFDAQNPLRLLVTVDPESRRPVAAYDRKTGEQVFSAEGLVRIHIDPEIRDGRVVGNPKPAHLSLIVRPSAWKDPRFSEASVIAVENVPTNDRAAYASFSYAKKNYSTSRRFDPEKPLKLLLLIDAGTRLPVAAYDQATGEEVYPSIGEMRVFLDPVLKEGRLPEEAKPFRMTQRVDKYLWSADEVQKADRVVLADVPTFSTRSLTASKIIAMFRFENKSYATSKLYDAGNPLNLLVEVEKRTKRVLAAYDMATGERMYHSSEEVAVYLDPAIEKGRLVGNPDPFRVGRFTWFVLEKALERNPKAIVLENVPAVNTSVAAGFRVLAESYQTRRKYDAGNPLSLLVVVDPKNGIPTAAYDQESGEEVFSIRDQIHAYLDPTVEGGRLAGNPPLYRVMRVVPGAFWKYSPVQQARMVAFGNMEFSRTHEDGEEIRLAGRAYRTGRKYDAERSPHLLVLADPRTGTLLRAYDESSGELVYPPADLVRAYKDAVIKSGRLAGDPEPFWEGRHMLPSFWNQDGVKQANVVVFSNVGTHKNLEGKMLFSMGGKQYRTTRRPDPADPLALLVSVDPRTKIPMEAYDLKSGEQVFPAPQQPGIPADPRLGNLTDLADAEEETQAGAEERIRIYRDPEIKNGLVVDGTEPVLTVGLMRKEIWGLPETRGSKQLVFDGVQSYRAKGDKARFGFNGEQYTTTMDSSELSRLTVVADAVSRLPLRAFQATTGKEVFSSGNHIKLYLNPRIVEGRLAPGSIPERQFLNLYPTLWRKVAKSKSGTVALENVSTSGSKGTVKGTAHFSFLSKRYPTRRAYDPANPLKLLVVTDTRLRIPTAAYDLATGEEVYSSSEEIEIYLDPVIEVGRLAEGSKSHLRMQIAGRYLWTDPGVRAAQRIGLRGVPTHQLPKVEWMLFSMMKRTFRTTRRFDARRPLRLLVVADVSTREPIAAYDVSTGEQVYSADRQLRVYLDPSFKEGKLGKTAEIYYQTSALIRSTFWKRPEVLKAKKLVFENWPVFSMRSRKFLFSLDYKRYLTDMEGDPAHLGEARLSLVVDPRGPIPLEAYDSKTGRKVFDWNERLRIYTDPEIQNGQLGKEMFPVRVSSNLSRAILKEFSSKAKVIAIAGVPTHQLSGGTAASFSLLRSRHRVSRLYDPANPLFLLVLMDVKSETVQAAYDMSTGEQVYPVKGETAADSRLSSLADLAEGEPTQAGAEEAAARAVEGWQSEEGTDAVVLSSGLLNQPYAEELKAALRSLPSDLAGRVYLAGNWEGLKEANRHLNVISNGSPDDVAVAVGQQAPAPEKVWLIGEFAPVYGWMLKQMGMEPEEIASGADIQEFLAQLGILLDVPEAQVQSGVEELRQVEEAVEAEA